MIRGRGKKCSVNDDALQPPFQIIQEIARRLCGPPGKIFAMTLMPIMALHTTIRFTFCMERLTSIVAAERSPKNFPPTGAGPGHLL